MEIVGGCKNPLLDESGNVVGVVVGKLNAMKVAKLIGDIPQNVNFAIKRLTLQSFLETNDVNYKTRSSKSSLKTADIVEQAKKYTVRVECWK